MKNQSKRPFIRTTSPDFAKTRLAKWILGFIILSFTVGCGCCLYHHDNTPKASNWNMHGEAIEWSGIQPYEKDKIASDLWFFGGCGLVVLSPILGMFFGVLAEKLSQMREDAEKTNKR